MEPKFNITINNNSFYVESLDMSGNSRYLIQFLDERNQIVYEAIIGDNSWASTPEKIYNIRIYEEKVLK